VPASSILLIDADPTAAASISSVLTKAGYSVTTSADAVDALPRVAGHQLVIVDILAGEQSGVAVCGEIRATPSMSSVPILCVARTDDVEERIRFLEAGADDVLGRPFDDRELEARVEALLLRFQRSRDIAAVVSADGVTVARVRRTVAVHSPKGGVGTSTIATNLAAVAATKKPDRVVIVDLDLQFGQVATFLDLQPRQTLADVVRDEAALREPELLRTYATRHDSGLHVLASPHGPEQAGLITADHVDRILSTLLDAYDQVIIDTGSWLDERTLQAFAAAENVLFVVNPEIATLKALSALLDYLNESGAVAGKSSFVLNNVFGREIVKSSDVEQALGTKVEIELPYDPFLYLKAVNEGRPVVLGAPKSAIAERMDRLTTIAFGLEGAVALPPIAEQRKSTGRFAFRRR
jgi:pilus assembly protein CpaE